MPKHYIYNGRYAPQTPKPETAFSISRHLSIYACPNCGSRDMETRTRLRHAFYECECGQLFDVEICSRGTIAYV